MQRDRPRLLTAVFYTIEHDGRVQRAAEALSERFDVTVLSVASGAQYSNPHFRSVQVPLPRWRFLQGARLFLFSWRVLREARSLRPQLIYVHDCFLPLVGLLAAAVVGAPFVYDAHELFIPEAGRGWTLRRRFFYWMERLSIRKAVLVIAANGERAAMMQEHYHLAASPLVIRNIPAPPDDAETAVDVAERYGLPGERRRIRVVYQGEMSLKRGLEPFILAAPLLAERCELLLIGGGPDLAQAQHLVAEIGASRHVTFLGKIPRGDLHSVLRACDIGIVTYTGRDLNNVYCAPNKVHEYAQAGLPMVLTPQPPLKAIVDEYRVGVICDCEGDRGAERAAKAVLSVADDLDTYRANLKRFVEDHQWSAEGQRLVEAVSPHCPYQREVFGRDGKKLAVGASQRGSQQRSLRVADGSANDPGTQSDMENPG